MYGIKTSLDLNSVKLVKTQFTALLLDMQNLANRNVIGIKVGNLNNQLQQSSSTLQGMGGHGRSLGESMSYATSQVIKFGLGLTAVYGTVKLIKDGISEIADINKSNTNVAMITNTDVKNVEKMNGKYMELAKNLKINYSEVLAGAENWMRAGVSMETANKNLETTTKLSKIAGVSNKEMSDSLITISNQYKMNSNDLEKYASSVSLLDNSSATSAEKINSAMQYSAETFKSVGINTDTALSYITNYSEKSAQSGQTIGRTFKSMMLNFQKMKLGFESQDENEMGSVNKLETLLNSKSIALRKSKTEWNNLGDVIKKVQQNITKFNPVEKSQLSFLIGGKEQAEATLSTLNNMTRINELQKKIKEDDGAQALANSYAKYLTSIEASKSQLRNTMTELYTATLSSDGLKTGIDMLIQIVQVTGFLITDSKALIATYVGLVVVIKNFGALSLAVGKLSVFIKALRVDSLATIGALNFNPVSIALVALTALFASIAYEKYKDSQVTKDLTRDYKSLNKAMSEFDTKGIMEGTVKIKAQQKELDKLAKLANVKTDMGMGVKDDSGQRALNKYIKSLREAGYVVNENTNKIKDLELAENMGHKTAMIQKIRDKTTATVENASATQSLIQQYLSLNGEENKSEAQKTILSNLTQELTGKVQGLTTSTDAHKNMVITNIDFLNNQVSALDLLKQQSTITANQEIKNAIATAQIMRDGSIQTLGDMQKKLAGYQALNKALAGTSAGKGGFFDAQIKANNMGAKDLEKSIGDINAMQDSMKKEFIIDAPSLSSNSTSTTGKDGGYKAQTEKEAQAEKDQSKAEAKADKARKSKEDKEAKAQKSKEDREAKAQKKKEEDAEKARQRHEDAVAKAEEKVARAERRVALAKTDSQKQSAKDALEVANAELKAVRLVGATAADIAQAKTQAIRDETTIMIDTQKKASDILIAGYQKQIEAINSKVKLEEKATTQLKYQNDIINGQNDLVNAQNQKNVRIYQDGKWQWQSDQTAIKAASQTLQGTQTEFAKFKSDNDTQSKIGVLEDKIKKEQDKQSNLTGYANGTDFVPKDDEYLVGEDGPEKVRLKKGNQVIPNHQLNVPLSNPGNAMDSSKLFANKPTSALAGFYAKSAITPNATNTLKKDAKTSLSTIGQSLKTNEKLIKTPVDMLLKNVDTSIDKFINSSPKYSKDANSNIGKSVKTNDKLVKVPVNNLVSDITNSLQTFVNSSPSFGKNTDKNIGNAITANSSSTTMPMDTIITTLKTGIETFVKNSYNSGTGITTQMGQGITDGSKALTDIVDQLTAKIILQFNTGFGIHSPSKVMYKIGGFLMEGLINGMSAADIEGFIKNKVSGMTDSAGGVMGQSLVDKAMQYLGTPYVWGGAAPGGFDCSGLVQYVYKQLGVDIGRTTYDQVAQGKAVNNKKDLQPGDIVFFGDPKSPHHEGMYIGDGKFIQAPATGQNVKITELDSRNDYAGARRIIQEPQNNAAGGNVDSWLKQAMKITNTSMEYFSALKQVVMGESGGDPKSINLYDSNFLAGHPSKGIAQMIDETFKTHMLKGYGDIWNPIDNLVSSIRYQVDRYGSIANTPGVKSIRNGGKYVGYATGSESVPRTEMAMKGEDGPELEIANKGDGILTTSITKNLMELGKYTPKSLMNLSNLTPKTIPNIILPKFEMPDINFNNMNSNPPKSDTYVTIQNVELPNVLDSEGFINQIIQISHVTG